MVTHIHKTKNIFVQSRKSLIFQYKHYVIRMIMNRSYFDDVSYQELRRIQHKLFPLTSDEEIDIMIDIQQNKRFFSDDEDF